MTGGGHLEFSHEKVDGKLETVLLRVLLSEKTQLFKIYMKKLQNDTMTYTSLRDGAISNNHRFTVTPIILNAAPHTLLHLAALCHAAL